MKYKFEVFMITGQREQLTPFYFEKDNIRFNFGAAYNQGLYEIIATVSNYVESKGELQSRFFGVPPSQGKWMHSHIFKIIYIQNKEKEQIDLIPDTYETIANNLLYIYKNAKNFSDVGENLIIHVENF